MKYDDAGPTLAGSGIVRVRNTTGRPLARLAVMWKDGRPGGLEVTIGGRPAPLAVTVFEPREFDLPAPLAPGREIEIGFRFVRGASKIEAGRDWVTPNGARACGGATTRTPLSTCALTLRRTFSSR